MEIMTQMMWEMLLCLLGAFLLGAIAGWLLKKMFGDGRLTQMESEWSARLTGKDQELATMNNNFRMQISSLQSNLDSASTSVRVREASIADWQSKFDALQNNFTEKSAAFDSNSQELGKLRLNLTAAESSLADKTKAHGLLEAELEKLRAEAKSRETDISSLRTRLQTLEPLPGQLSEKTASLAELEKENASLRKVAGEIELLRTSLQSRDARIGTLEKELESLRKRNSEIEPAVAKLSVWETKYLQDTQSRDNEITKLRKRVAELEDTSSKAKNWEMKFLSVSGDKEREVGELQQRIRELEPLRSQAKDWEVKYLAVLQEKENETKGLRQRITELEPLSARLTDWEKKYRTDVDEKDGVIVSLRERISSLESATVTARPEPAPAAPISDLIEIEGIGDFYYSKFAAIGMTTQAQLIAQGATQKGRAEIAEKTGIPEKLILRWVNHVDLIRINGVGPQFAELLEAAGVDTVPELAQRNAQNLVQKMTEVNEARNLTGRVPTLNEVTAWIAEAKTLPRIITH
jgi:predicted flap endonuclease-1-like 5' DNA nuclease/predicted  nucleic acid-binding Zn-ribbon protein